MTETGDKEQAKDPENGKAVTVTAEQLSPDPSQHTSLKHHLLGPSLTKSGQDGVDLKKVSEIIYQASKGSKFFNNEQAKDKNLTVKIDSILKLKAQLDKIDLKHDLRRADDYLAQLELSRDLSQHIVHIDCDAFYAAVEEIGRPELKNVPMAVGVGVLTTCNYEARKFGCRSAMASFVAKKLCPQLVCLAPNFDTYTAKAKEVRAILAEYDGNFESASIDEAYMNITQYCRDHQMDPESVMEQMRREVHEQCRVTISAGIAPNAKLAKICSNKNKPNGQYRLASDRAAVMSFMKDLPVRKVNGIGRVLERELDAIGIKTCGDMYEYRAYLHRLFGEKTFQFLLQTYLGLGRTDIQPAEDSERKSVGTESTFADISSKQDLRDKLRHTAEELEKDMREAQVKGRTLCLKIKLHTYEVLTRQIQPPKAVNQADDLYSYSLPLLAKLEKETPDLRIRLMGLRCTHLVSTKKEGGNFFKRRPVQTAAGQDGEWEVWPDEEFEKAARQEQQEEMDQMERLSQECALEEEQQQQQQNKSRIDEQNTSTTSPNKSRIDEQNTSTTSPSLFWDCPVCGFSQPANDRDFNMHLDLCLSRQTIKETVAESLPPIAAAVGYNGAAAGSGRIQPSAGQKRKGGHTAGPDVDTATRPPRQKKLFFA
ncbi:hypothetical protein DV735_g924, partial [Chaetothyriales sp. CBS 134920]